MPNPQSTRQILDVLRRMPQEERLALLDRMFFTRPDADLADRLLRPTDGGKEDG